MANGDILWAISKVAYNVGGIIKLTALGTIWIRQDSVQLTRAQVDWKYFTFESFEEASQNASNMDEYLQKLKERTEKLKQNAIDEQVRKDEEHQRKLNEDEASMEFIRNTLNIAEEFQFSVFKTFIKEIVFIDTKLVNKALFAVTLNKRFKGFLYKVENDSQFLQHVSANQMKEVLQMILLRR